MNVLEDHEKALVLLYIIKNGLPEWEKDSDKNTIAVLAALCFEGNVDQAADAISRCEHLGFINREGGRK